MTINVGINGFGRIGRATLAHISESGREDIKVVKLNATGPLETAAHLMRYDSVHGRYPGTVTTGDATMDLGRGAIQMLSTPSTGASQLSHFPSGLRRPCAFVGLPNRCSRGISGVSAHGAFGRAAADTVVMVSPLVEGDRWEPAGVLPSYNAGLL